jgi:putative PIN family toxin of toxin-antitoxin system
MRSSMLASGLVYSPAVVDEWLDVVTLPHIRARHGMDDDEILELLAAVLIDGQRYPGTIDVSAQLTRDLTDTKLLSLALESNADYLVTNDRRHLLRLKRFARTKIVTPGEFLRRLR